MVALGPKSFNGVAAIWTKMVPYTAAQLTTYELLTAHLYASFPNLAADTPLLVFPARLACAAFAAVVSSLLSQPGDTLLSEVNKIRKEDTVKPPSGLPSVPKMADPDRAVDKAQGTELTQGDAPLPPTKLSKLRRPPSRQEGGTKSLGAQVAELGDVARELGFSGLMRGTQARLVQMLFIVVVQLLIYDYAKALVGLPVTGSAH